MSQPAGSSPGTAAPKKKGSSSAAAWGALGFVFCLLCVMPPALWFVDRLGPRRSADHRNHNSGNNAASHEIVIEAPMPPMAGAGTAVRPLASVRSSRRASCPVVPLSHHPPAYTHAHSSAGGARRSTNNHRLSSNRQRTVSHNNHRLTSNRQLSHSQHYHRSHRTYGRRPTVVPIPNYVRAAVAAAASPQAPRAVPAPQNTKHDRASISDDEGMCVACMDEVRSVMLQPCGHLCLCTVCSAHPTITRCPLCRCPIGHRVQLSYQ